MLNLSYVVPLIEPKRRYFGYFFFSFLNFGIKRKLKKKKTDIKKKEKKLRLLEGDDNDFEVQFSILTYGTLKRGFSNHGLMQSLIDQNDTIFLGTHVTLHSYPLVCGPNGIPYLINLPRLGHRVKGELYSMSTHGLDHQDELEGTALDHYERLPIQTQVEAEAEAEAKAYYAHCSFGEELWEKNRREGLSEYTERKVSGFVRRG